MIMVRYGNFCSAFYYSTTCSCDSTYCGRYRNVHINGAFQPKLHQNTAARL